MYNKIGKISPSKSLMFAPKWEEILKKFINPTELQVEINKEKCFINGFPFDSISIKENTVYFSASVNSGRRRTTLAEIRTFLEIDKNVERIYKKSEDSDFVESYQEIVTDTKITLKIGDKEYPLKYKSSYDYYTYKKTIDSIGREYFEKCSELECNKLKSFNKYLIFGNQQVEFGEAFYYNQKGKLVNKIDFDKDYKKSFFDIKNKLSEYNNYEGFVQKNIVNNKPFWQLNFSSLEKENKELVDFTLYIDGKTGEIFNQKPLIDDTQNLYEKIANQNNFKILKLSQTKNFLTLLKSTTEKIFLNDIIENINSSGRYIQFKADQQQKDINLFCSGIILKTNKDLEYKSWFQYTHRFSDNVGVIDVPSKTVFLNFSNILSSNVTQNKQLHNRLTDSNFIVQEIQYSLNDKIEIIFLGYFEKIVDDYESEHIRYTIIFNIETNETKVSMETNDRFESKVRKDIILIKK
jgi:hypothetical protein